MELILMALGACFLYVLQRVLYERFWKKGLTADAAFQGNPAVCGGEAYLLETVVNAKFLPLSILRVKFRIGRELEFVTGENSAVSDYTYATTSSPSFLIRRSRESCGSTAANADITK